MTECNNIPIYTPVMKIVMSLISQGDLFSPMVVFHCMPRDSLVTEENVASLCGQIICRYRDARPLDYNHKSYDNAQ